MLTADSRIRSGDCPYAHHRRPSIKTRPFAWTAGRVLDEKCARRNRLHRQGRVLADRVRSYFQKGSDQTPKTSLLGQIADLETIVTRSVLEALILESNLIKRHRPRFNVVLRDDKQYPYLRLPIKEDFPRLSIVRRVQKDGALYYGPYTPAGALRETLKVIRKVFPLATCEIDINGKAERACIEFEIKRCMAPCIGNQSRDDYHLIVKQVRQFLEGRDTDCWTACEEMERAAEQEQFEEAARLRDRIFNVDRTLEKQRITQISAADQDVVGLARQGAAADLQLLFVRGGLLIGRKDFFWPQSGDASDEELVRSAIEQFYNKEGLPPKEILVPTALDDAPLIEAVADGEEEAKPCGSWLLSVAPSINCATRRRKCRRRHRRPFARTKPWTVRRRRS